MRELIRKLDSQKELDREELVYMLSHRNDNPEDREYLFQLARERAIENYGHQIYLRGLIEFTNYCKNDCYYCGIRAGNNKAERYRLTEDQVMDCCDAGYGFGFRTFVLQGGEDPWYTDDRICHMVARIRDKYPDCAITLSIGEKERTSYQKFFDAGADRYLLRHETADPCHYRKLHPEALSIEHRKKCLRDLKDIGYQIGAGFMMGSPYQTYENLADDFLYLKELQPHMIGIGPFIHHSDTPFRDMADGTLEMTLFCLGMLRLMFPKVLLPATTALGTIDPLGREKGVQAGANVVMPSLSPKGVRGKYLLYDGKICTGEEAAECHHCMEMRMERIGYKTVSARGDYKGWSRGAAGACDER